MLLKCYTCGNMHEGSSCPVCAQLRATQRIADATENQNKLIEKQRINDHIERRRLEREQEENQQEALIAAMLEAARQEVEQFIKQSFAELVLIIQTNQENEIKSKAAQYLGNLYPNQPELRCLAPDVAKKYNKHFVDFIIANPTLAKQLSIAKSIFEEIANAGEIEYNRRELENQKIEQEAIAEKAKQDLINAENEKVNLAERTKDRKIQIVTVIIGVSSVFATFIFGELGANLYSAGFALIVLICLAVNSIYSGNDGANHVAEGFIKGLNK